MRRVEFADTLAARLNRPESNIYRIYRSPDHIDKFVFPGGDLSIEEGLKQELGESDPIQQQVLDDFREPLGSGLCFCVVYEE